MKKLNIAAVVCVAVLFVSCGNVQWHSDFEEAKAAAARQKKNMYLLFSGDDWADSSLPFKENVVNTKEFAKRYGSEFVFANIDFSQADYAHSQVSEDATEEERREAEKIQDEYKEKELLARHCNVQSWPCAFIVSPQGYVLAEISLDAEKYSSISVEDYCAEIENAKERAKNLMQLSDSLNHLQGIERAKAIDEMVQNSSRSHSYFLKDLILEFPSLDPENKTGRLGDYQIQGAYLRSLDAFEDGSDPALPFDEISKSADLSSLQKQEALYMAAYALVNMSEIDFDRVQAYLEEAYAVDTQSEISGEIFQALEGIRRYSEMASASQTAQPAQQQSGN